MDTKNVIAAISLSAAVIILYSLFWAPPPPDTKLLQTEKNKVIDDEQSGLYMIKELVHYYEGRGSFTKLKLIRDTMGKKDK